MTVLLIILLQLLSVVAGITTVIWVINRGLKVAGSFLAAWLLVLLPLLAFQQTQAYVGDFVSTFSQWGVTEIPLFSAVTWAMVGGSCAASIFSGLVLWTGKTREDRNSIAIFMWIAFALTLLGYLLVPVIFFGQFGRQLAFDNLFWLSFYGIMTFALTILLFASRALHNRFSLS